MAKLSIFLKNIQWENCSKLIFEQLSHGMSSRNIDCVAVTMENVFLATKVTTDVLVIWPFQKTKPNNFLMVISKTPRGFYHQPYYQCKIDILG